VALPVLAALLALFSTLSLALRIPSRVRISEQFERTGRADRLHQFVVDRARYMLATAISRSLVVLVLFIGVMYYQVTAENQLLTPSNPLARVIVACVLAWTIVLVFGVAIPNAWAKYSGEWLIVGCLPLLALLRWACFPLLVIVELFDPLVRRLAGVPHRDAQSFADELEQEILHAVSEGELHGAVDEEEKEMIESVIELTDTRVAEIMTPRTDVVALPKDADPTTVLETIRANGHSRIPVFDETIDTILGVLYAKDLLLREEDKPFSLTSVMRKALFVPETKSVRELLREFQVQRVHIAIVLDEYGGTAGLVTIEDILEELVGEITDEYEPELPAEMKRIDEHTVEVDARMRIDDLNHELDIEFPEDEDYETIGGFVFSTMGRIPKPGEHCEYGNVAIHVVAAEPRRVTRLRLKINPAGENQRVAG
jgi:putative hemolysin